MVVGNTGAEKTIYEKSLALKNSAFIFSLDEWNNTQVEAFKMAFGIENLIDSTFLKEVRRRKELIKQARNTERHISDSLIWNYNQLKVKPISDSINANIDKWIK